MRRRRSLSERGFRRRSEPTVTAPSGPRWMLANASRRSGLFSASRSRAFSARSTLGPLFSAATFAATRCVAVVLGGASGGGGRDGRDGSGRAGGLLPPELGRAVARGDGDVIAATEGGRDVSGEGRGNASSPGRPGSASARTKRPEGNETNLRSGGGRRTSGLCSGSARCAPRAQTSCETSISPRVAYA